MLRSALYEGARKSSETPGLPALTALLTRFTHPALIQALGLPSSVPRQPEALITNNGGPRSWSSSAVGGISHGGAKQGEEGGVGLAASSVPSTPSLLGRNDSEYASMTPQAVFEKLNRYIVGQEEAKKAVAVAFRNRWRRHRVEPASLRQDITPKNLLMIGPTGCGKTEIARRLAKLADAPFVKVEATKFTEVGYHGKDVDSIIKDLVENAITLVRRRLREKMQEELKMVVEAQLLKLLSAVEPESMSTSSTSTEGKSQEHDQIELARKLQNKELEDVMVDVELPQNKSQKFDLDLSGLQNPQQMQTQTFIVPLERLMGGGRKERRRMSVAEARTLLEEAESERMFPPEMIAKEALALAAQDGIVFIDEIDKVVTSRNSAWRGGDPSSEGVQRDLLPIIEGSTVQTKHGNLETDHILFICSGAFHAVKPSDLMAELQGRLPIRVELKALSCNDFYRILTEPEFNLVKQQQMLMAAEGVDLEFTEDALREIAKVAEEVNKILENIGARRLHAIMERIIEPLSFDAPDLVASAKAEGKERHHKVIDKDEVAERVSVFLKKQDLSRHII